VPIIDLLHPPIDLAPLERLILPDDVGGYAAWQVMVRDGALVPLCGEAALPVGVAATQELRAEAIGLVAPPEAQADSRPLVVSSLAAAWIWLGGIAPAEVEYTFHLGRYRAAETCLAVRASQFTANDVCRINGLWVTNPERTIRDLALWCPFDQAVPLIKGLIAAGASLAIAEAMLERPMRLTNRPAARLVLQTAARPTSASLYKRPADAASCLTVGILFDELGKVA